MIKNLCVGFTVSLFLVGCGTPKIDTSSDEKMKISIQKIKESLSTEEQKRFEDAIQVIAFSNINMSNLFLGEHTSLNNFGENIKIILNNKTAKEVVLESEKIVAKRFEEEKKQALKEIKNLEEKKAYAEQSKEVLKRFEVIASHFFQREEKYSTYKQPIIDLEVKNLTGKAISRVYFIGTVKSTNREIPWIKESFNYSIPGGLEVGEVATWSLAPNMFSEWGIVSVPQDSIFEVEVVQFDDANSIPIASIQDFNKNDLKRLEELKSKYN